MGKFLKDPNLLKEIIKYSYTQVEVINSIRRKGYGYSFKSLRKFINDNSIDITHFKSEEIRLGKLKEFITNKKKTPTKELLVINSTAQRKEVKKRLYDEGLKERKCELDVCGQGEIWNGKKISLILDHINGINNDNRLENLRILCPNCNASLDTHCRGSKNKKYA